MSQCNQRLFLFTVCSLQLISTIERQVFDLLGYQWLPIAANFLHIIFVIIGFFGGYQYRKSYLITYSVWQFLWLAWNSFVVCFYLNIGILNRDSDILNIGTGAASWWEVNGIGCHPYFSVNSTFSAAVQPGDLLRPPRPDLVDGCLLNYYYVEVIHAAVQLILAFIGLLSFMLILRSYTAEDDAFDFIGGFGKSDDCGLHESYLLPTYTRHDATVAQDDEPQIDELILNLLSSSA